MGGWGEAFPFPTASGPLRTTKPPPVEMEDGESDEEEMLDATTLDEEE